MSDQLLIFDGSDYTYEEVGIDEEFESEGDVESEDLEATLHSLQKLSFLLGKGQKSVAVPEVRRQREVLDDFVRNFCMTYNLHKTLEVFEVEWFDAKEKGRVIDSKLIMVPDEYSRSLQLTNILKRLQDQLEQQSVVAQCRAEMLEKFRKERNLHRMHHNRIAQEKNKLVNVIKRLRTHFGKYDGLLEQLKKKYEQAVKAKALMALERDKLRTIVEKAELFTEDNPLSPTYKGPKYGKNSMTPVSKPDPLISACKINPFHEARISVTDVRGYTLKNTFRGHNMSVSNVVIHPKKPLVVTASDDGTWRMWGLPAGDLIMTGEGHKDWVSGLDFHPKGMHLASTSGDCTVKLWSFEKSRCIHTFADHTQAVWSVSYHTSGDVLASSSLDHTSRLWDLFSMKCRGTLRGHVDSVNSITWQLYSSILCTSSSDKTVSLWDARSALCVQTFYGHKASCNHACFDNKGYMIASVDADGIAKLWDVRKVAEYATINVGPQSANRCCFDPSGLIIAIASNDQRIKCFQIDLEVVPVSELRGHEDAVQAVQFDPKGNFLVSGSSDSTFRVWGSFESKSKAGRAENPESSNDYPC
ncbi:flagellar WD repeat-containing protein Pf20 isoform X2 [Physcomitrium patens]|uniref:flagellar WD repeat-containing protein Pf20 isoform X2 n=1 Tax=Physcomitrium patens TaxID=3218 RepID=UPI003CCD1922